MTDTETPKRGPGRPPKIREPEEPTEQSTEAKRGGTKVTYHPLEPGDPHEVEWDGLKFEANVAREVSSKHRDLIESAKGNAWFSVEGHPRAKRVKPVLEPIMPPGRDVDPVALDDRKMIEDD